MAWPDLTPCQQEHKAGVEFALMAPAHTIHPSGPTEGEVVSSSVCHWPLSVPLTAFLLVSNAVHGLRHLRVKNLTSFFRY